MKSISEIVDDTLEDRSTTDLSDCCDAGLIGEDEPGGILIRCEECRNEQFFIYMCPICNKVAIIDKIEDDIWAKNCAKALSEHVCLNNE